MQTQQLSASSARPSFPLPHHGTTSPFARTISPRGPAGTAVLAAAAVHASLLVVHHHAWPSAGWFSAALQVVQAAAAVPVVLAPERLVQPAVLAVMAGASALWVATRPQGVPLGLVDRRMPEVAGVPDTASARLTLAAHRGRGSASAWPGR